MRKIVSIFFFLNFFSTAHAAPNFLTFNGYLSSSGTAVNATVPMTFDIYISNGGNTCWLYTETVASVSISSGDFVQSIGTAGTYKAGTKLADIFNSNTSITGVQGSVGTCSGAISGSSAATSWFINITVNGTNMGQVPVNTVPFATTAVNAENLNGLPVTSFVQTTNSTWSQIIGGTYNAPSATTALTCTTATNVSGTVALANGGTGATTAAAARSNLGLGTTALINNSGVATDILHGDGSWSAPASAPVTSVAGRTGAVTLTSVDLSDFSTATDARINLQKGSASGLATLNASSKIPSTQLALVATDIPSLDASKITTGTITNNVSSTLVSGTTGQFTNLKIYDGSTNYLTQASPVGGFGGSGYTIQWPSAAGTSNQVLGITSVASTVAVLGWITPSGGTVTGVTASAPLSSSGGVAPNITITQASSGSNGYLSSTDWNTFNSKQSAGSYITGLNGDVAATGPGLVAATIANNAITTTKIADGAITTTKALTINPGISRLVATDGSTGATLAPISCGFNQVLSATAGGSWQCNAISSIYAAPVTSVAGKTGSVSLISADITDASSANVGNALVKRDVNGDFSSNNVNANAVNASTVSASGSVSTNSLNVSGTVNCTNCVSSNNIAPSSVTTLHMPPDNHGSFTVSGPGSSVGTPSAIYTFTADEPGIYLVSMNLTRVSSSTSSAFVGFQLWNASSLVAIEPSGSFNTYDYQVTASGYAIARNFIYNKTTTGSETIQVRWVTGSSSNSSTVTISVDSYDSVLNGWGSDFNVIKMKR